MKKIMKPVAIALTFSFLLGGTAVIAKQPKKATIKTTKFSIQKGKTKTIGLKNKQKKAVYTFKSSKKSIATVSKKGKVTAKKIGTAKITVREKLGTKNRKVGIVTVVVFNKTSEKDSSSRNTPVSTPVVIPTVAPTTAPSAAPTGTPTGTPSAAPTETATSAPTEAPTTVPTETPAATSTPDPIPLVQTNLKINGIPKDFTEELDDVQYGTKITTRYYSSTTGKDRNVIVILPNGYTETKKYPVMYLFHGGMGDEKDWISGKVEYMIGNMIASGEAKEMILVLPNCRCRENDSAANADGFALGHVQSFDHFLDDFRDNLMPFINKTYSVAEGRENTAIAGLSMGGRVSLNIGFHLTSDVGYIGAFSPAYGIFPYTNMGLTEEGLFTEETFTLPTEYNGNTLVMINNGLQDTMVKDEPERYHNALVANGVDHCYYTTTGGHDWVVWKHGFYNFARYAFQPKENWVE